MVPLALVPALLLPLAAGAPPARGAELYRPLMSAVLRNVEKGGTVVITTDASPRSERRWRWPPSWAPPR